MTKPSKPEKVFSLSARISFWRRRLREIEDSFWLWLRVLFSKAKTSLTEFFALLSGKGEPTQDAKREAAEEAEHSEPPLSFTPTRTKPQPPITHDEIANQAEKDWWDKSKRWVELGGVVLLAVYTGFTVLMYFSNKEAVRYAGDANKLNKDAVIGVQRAFITFQGVNFKTVQSRDQTGTTRQHLYFEAQARNDGNTPAVDVINYFGIVKADGREPTDKEFIGSENDFRKTTIGPKVQIGLGPVVRSGTELIGFEFPHSPQDVKSTIGVRGGVFFTGWIAYRDVFPDTRLHVTEFCQQLTYVSFVTTVQPNTYGLNFIGCRERNCTDEYCENYQQMQEAVKNAKK